MGEKSFLQPRNAAKVSSIMFAGLLVVACAGLALARGGGHGGGRHSSGGGYRGSHSSAGSHTSGEGHSGGQHSSVGRTPSVSSSHGFSSSAARDSHGLIERSSTAKREFERMTGYPHGRTGYVIDHVVPLANGRADSPSNMQWQTIPDAEAKDRWERLQ